MFENRSENKENKKTSFMNSDRLKPKQNGGFFGKTYKKNDQKKKINFFFKTKKPLYKEEEKDENFYNEEEKYNAGEKSDFFLNGSNKKKMENSNSGFSEEKFRNQPPTFFTKSKKLSKNENYKKPKNKVFSNRIENSSSSDKSSRRESSTPSFETPSIFLNEPLNNKYTSHQKPQKKYINFSNSCFKSGSLESNSNSSSSKSLTITLQFKKPSYNFTKKTLSKLEYPPSLHMKNLKHQFFENNDLYNYPFKNALFNAIEHIKELEEKIKFTKNSKKSTGDDYMYQLIKQVSEKNFLLKNTLEELQTAENQLSIMADKYFEIELELNQFKEKCLGIQKEFEDYENQTLMQNVENLKISAKNEVMESFIANLWEITKLTYPQKEKLESVENSSSCFAMDIMSKHFLAMPFLYKCKSVPIKNCKETFIKKLNWLRGRSYISLLLNFQNSEAKFKTRKEFYLTSMLDRQFQKQKYELEKKLKLFVIDSHKYDENCDCEYCEEQAGWMKDPTVPKIAYGEEIFCSKRMIAGNSPYIEEICKNRTKKKKKTNLEKNEMKSQQKNSILLSNPNFDFYEAYEKSIKASFRFLDAPEDIIKSVYYKVSEFGEKNAKNMKEFQKRYKTWLKQILNILVAQRMFKISELELSSLYKLLYEPKENIDITAGLLGVYAGDCKLVARFEEFEVLNLEPNIEILIMKEDLEKNYNIENSGQEKDYLKKNKKSGERIKKLSGTFEEIEKIISAAIPRDPSIPESYYQALMRLGSKLDKIMNLLAIEKLESTYNGKKTIFDFVDVCKSVGAF